MSKFITNSANYSESMLIKSKILKPILEKYNESILYSKAITNTLDISSKIFIPNNNNKYFLFVLNKSDIDKSTAKSNYKILYFFPENFSNLNSDFFIEIDFLNKFSKKSYLFEGYMYENNKKYTFLITDILAIENTIINSDYKFRLDLANNIVNENENKGINNINCFMDINIHPVFIYDESNFNQILDIFKNNFKVVDCKEKLTTLEYIEMSFGTLKKKHSEKCKNNKTTKIMIIQNTKYTDVYNVIDIDTGNNEGILYISSLVTSKNIREKVTALENSSTFNLKCTYNSKFYKWEPAKL
jgi:hypothetical protein